MRLIVVGAGGHASVVIDVARLAIAGCEIVGVLDDAPSRDHEVSGVRVLGATGEIGRFAHDAVAIAIGDNVARAWLFERLRAADENFPTLIHPSATIARSASVGAGTVVLAHAVVNAAAVVAEDVIVNTAATIDHHCLVESHAHLAPGVHLAGLCRVGEGATIGIGAVLAPGVSVGARTMVGAGAVVLEDLPSDVVAFGVPARVVRERGPGG